MIRIGVVDDHHIVRQGVIRLLEEQPDFNVVAEGTSGADVPTIVATASPEVLVMDLSMPNSDGFSALDLLSRQSDAPAAVVLSMHDDAASVQRAMRSGARAYVLKQAVADELVDAVRAAHRGGLYLCAEVAAQSLGVAGTDGGQNNMERLSPREREVAELIASGLSTKQIATRLETSVKTVQKQRQAAMRKLEAPNTAVLVRKLLESAARPGTPS